ncbi:hypothetical protein SUNI508_12075 [Seiridium unicorne]|uniref:Uncharacterized protein n=1 Tax=Seiridium unicorne TaxID=138068 RepID=A0ABR2UEM9_9PEZI
MSLCCGLFQRRPARQPAQPAQGNNDGLQGVEFSPRTSYASSHNEEITTTRPSTNAQRPAAVPQATQNQHPELVGYYSPSASALARPQVLYRPSQELAGFYGPQPAVSQQPQRYQESHVMPGYG